MKKRFILSVLLLLSILTHSQNSEQDCESAKQKYLQQNPDVARAGMNAWTHYTTFGKNEGRKWPKCKDSEQNKELYNEADNNIYNSAYVEVKPNYPGGLENFYNFFLKNFQVQEEGLKGKDFVVNFVVEKDGSLTDIKVLKDIGYGTGKEDVKVWKNCPIDYGIGKEVVRVLKSCPRWNSGEQNGKKVRVLYGYSIEIDANNIPFFYIVNGAGMSFESEVIDYGTISRGADGKREFIFVNNGNKPLLIEKLQGSCTCIIIEDPKGEIAPGAGGKIKIHYDTDRVGTFIKTITVWSNSSNQTTKVLTIKGNVLPDISDNSQVATQNISKCISGDCINGKGISNRPDGHKYEGEFKNGKMEGKGTYFFTNGNKYEGDFKNNTNEGEGIFYYANGDRYEGEFKNGAMEGKGTQYYTNGDKFEGEFKNNERDGSGTYYYANGSIYRGYYKNNERDGSGEFFLRDIGTVKGNFVKGNFEGEVIATYIDGSKYIGIFKNYLPEGYGKEYDKNGNLIYEGEYKNGRKIETNSSNLNTSSSNIDLTDSENEEKIRKIIYKVTIDKIVKKDKSNSKVLESRIIKKVEAEILLRKATQKDIADIKKNIKYTADLLQLSAAITPKPKVKCDWCNKKIIGKGVNYEVRDGACWISDIYINNYGFNIFCCREHAYKYCNSRN